MRPIIVANWKMNPQTAFETRQLFKSVGRGLKDIKNVEVVVCPPYTQFSIFNFQFSKNIKLGAQDCFWEEKGAFTGEVSPRMLRNIGCKYVIIGHSERRKYLKETDEMINKKLKAALKSNLRPILCVGDKSRESREDIKEIALQLKIALKGLKKSILSKLIITYEPVWAISTTRGSVAATPKDAMEGVLYIKNILYKLFGEALTKKIKIIYGGSVDSKNINSFIYKGQVDGALVGAASLNPKEFVQIVKRVS